MLLEAMTALMKTLQKLRTGFREKKSEVKLRNFSFKRLNLTINELKYLFGKLTLHLIKSFVVITGNSDDMQSSFVQIQPP